MKKLTIICYLAGIVLIAITLKIKSDINTQKSAHITVNENFDLDGFLNSKDFEFYEEKFQPKPNHITAMYVISSAQCKPCINEVINFNYFFSKYNLKSFPVQQCVAVIDSSKKRVLRFIKTTEFITPVVFGNDEKYVPFLHSFGFRKAYRQLLLINNNSNTVFFRIHLKKGKMTPESSMKKIIKNAEIVLFNNLL